MSLNNLAKSVVLGLAVLLASSAFASNKSTLNFQETVEVNGQAIPAGTYQLRWEGSGSNVELSIMQGKKEVAKATAKMIQLQEPSAYDSTVVDHSNGKATVSEIRFQGKKSAIAIGPSDRASMSGSSN